MKAPTDWEVIIEYGPTAADSHKITVTAKNSVEALALAEEWAESNNVPNPMFSRPRQILEVPKESIIDDDYTDVIEWTPEEEEAFVSMLSNNRPTFE